MDLFRFVCRDFPRFGSALERLRDAGAKILTGTLVVDAVRELTRDEAFGPAMTLHAAPGDATALDLANRCAGGLAGNVFGGETSEHSLLTEHSRGPDDIAMTDPATGTATREGRRLHRARTGSGSPTVLLEAGVGAGGTMWGPVMARLAGATQILTYDRVGYRGSPPAATSGADAVLDLEEVLRVADVSGPLMLVGHRWVEAPNSGHAVPQQDPDLLADVLREVLNQTSTVDD